MFGRVTSTKSAKRWREICEMDYSKYMIHPSYPALIITYGPVQVLNASIR